MKATYLRITGLYIRWADWDLEKNQLESVTTFLKDDEIAKTIAAAAETAWEARFGKDPYDSYYPVITDGNEKYTRDNARFESYKDQRVMKINCGKQGCKYIDEESNLMRAQSAKDLIRPGAVCEIFMAMTGVEIAEKRFIAKRLMVIQFLGRSEVTEDDHDHVKRLLSKDEEKLADMWFKK